MQPKGGRAAASLGSRSARGHEPGTGSVIRASLADTLPSSPLVTGPRWGPIHGGDAYPKEAAIASTLGLHDGGPLDHHRTPEGALDQRLGCVTAISGTTAKLQMRIGSKDLGSHLASDCFDPNYSPPLRINRIACPSIKNFGWITPRYIHSRYLPSMDLEQLDRKHV